MSPANPARGHPAGPCTSQQSTPDALALHAAGVRALAEGRAASAITALRASLELQPGNPPAHYHLGRALRAAGQQDAALVHYDRAIALDPRLWEAHSSRGVLLRGLGRLQESVASQRAALALQPNATEVHFNLANALFADNQTQMAIAAYQQVLTRQPDHARARRGLMTAQAYLMLEGQRWAESLALHQQLVRDYPDVAALHNGLAVTQWHLGDPDGTRASLARASALEPGDGFACLHSGMLLNRNDLWSAALPWLESACQRLPDFLPALLEWGIALLYSGDPEGALQKFDAACAADPANPMAPYNRAFANLMLGRLTEGYRDFEHRFEEGLTDGVRRPSFTMPTWQGEDLSQRHLLVWTEQGAGDALQYVRYLPRLAAMRPGRLSVGAHAGLQRLLRASFPDLDLKPVDAPLPEPADFECPLMSLPLRLNCAEDLLIDRIPYLRCPEDLVTAWRHRLGRSARLRIGLAWSGNPDQKRNHIRSIPLSYLAGLIAHYSNTGACEFHVLQKGNGLQELATRPDLPLIRSSDHCNDFADTAALISTLDLIITVDTSIAHLAGGLGHPTWILLARIPDWRYGPEGGDCAWYPSARVFRQPAHGDWASVVHRLSRALDSLLAVRADTREGTSV